LPGGPLFDAALAARQVMVDPLPLRIVAGPFLPAGSVARPAAADLGPAGVELVRHVPDMVAEMRRARASLSQCGYNTALDLVVAGVPALVVPYETVTENEQSQRAQRLARLGVLRHLPTEQARRPALAHALAELLAFTAAARRAGLDGARAAPRS
jgi:predicted glycosyltransferase